MYHSNGPFMGAFTLREHHTLTPLSLLQAIIRVMPRDVMPLKPEDIRARGAHPDSLVLVGQRVHIQAHVILLAAWTLAMIRH
jgi:hypothetical protein